MTTLDWGICAVFGMVLLAIALNEIGCALDKKYNGTRQLVLEAVRSQQPLSTMATMHAYVNTYAKVPPSPRAMRNALATLVAEGVVSVRHSDVSHLEYYWITEDFAPSRLNAL